MPIFKQEAEFLLKDFRRPAFGESINPERSSVMADGGAAVLDGGTFITGKGGDNREIKRFLPFFSNTFPFIGMLRLMRIAHKKNEVHKKVVQ